MSLIYDIHDYTIGKYIDNYADFMKYLILVRNTDIREILKNKYIPRFTMEKTKYNEDAVCAIFWNIPYLINDDTTVIYINSVSFFEENDTIYPNVKKLFVEYNKENDVNDFIKIFPNITTFETDNANVFKLMAINNNNIKTIKLDAKEIESIEYFPQRKCKLIVKICDINTMGRMKDVIVHYYANELHNLETLPLDYNIQRIYLSICANSNVDIKISNKRVKKLKILITDIGRSDPHISITDLPNLERLMINNFSHKSIIFHLVDIPYLVDLIIVESNKDSVKIIQERTKIIRIKK